MPHTPITKPVVGGSSGAWGSILNNIIDQLNTEVDTARNTADAALPKSGGTMTGELVALTEVYTAVDLGSPIPDPVTINVDNGNFFYGTITGDVTFNEPTGEAASGLVHFILLELTNPGAGGATLTFPASFKWPGGAPPSWTVSGVDLISLYTRDGGATWRAARVQENSS